MWSVEKEKEIIPKVLQLSFSSISCVFRYTNTVYSLTTLKPSIALIPFQNNVENGQRMGKEVHKQNFGQTHQKCGANLCCHGAAVIPPRCCCGPLTGPREQGQVYLFFLLLYAQSRLACSLQAAGTHSSQAHSRVLSASLGCCRTISGTQSSELQLETGVGEKGWG